MKNTSAFFLAVLLLISTTGCFRNFYKTNSVSYPDSTILKLATDTGKLVFVHFKDSIVQFENVSVSNDTINGKMTITLQNDRYMRPSPTAPNVMKEIDRNLVLSQIHVYVNENIPATENEILILKSQITRYDVYGPDKKATRNSKTVSIMGLVVASIAVTILLLGVLIAAIL